MNAVAGGPVAPLPGRPSSAGWRVALRLGRVSNLPTVWTNVLAGAVLAGADPIGSAAVLLPLLAASLLYVAGMYLNDAFDAEIDARQRSNRPIPSGEVGRALVLRAGFAMLALGVLLFLLTGWRAGVAGLALAGLIVAYDRHHKGNPLSPVVMGLCRFMVYVAAGLALAGGLTAASWLGAALLLAYLVGLTYAAKQEHLNELGSAWPLAFLAAPLLYGLALLGGGGWPVAAIWAGLLLWVAYAVSFLFRRPRVVPRAVVSLIAGISLLDALLAAGHGAPGVAALCVLGFALTLAFQRVVPGT